MFLEAPDNASSDDLQRLLQRAGVSEGDDLFCLDTIWVHESRRRHRVGSRLLQQLKEQCSREGARGIYAAPEMLGGAADHKNGAQAAAEPQALNFFRKQGFEDLGLTGGVPHLFLRTAPAVAAQGAAKGGPGVAEPTVTYRLLTEGDLKALKVRCSY